MSDIVEIVSTVGFPIVSFLLAGYFIKYSYDKMLEKDKEHDIRDDKHWEEIAKLTQAVSDNSKALSDLVMEVKKDD